MSDSRLLRLDNMSDPSKLGSDKVSRPILVGSRMPNPRAKAGGCKPKFFWFSKHVKPTSNHSWSSILVRPYQGRSVNLATPKARRCRLNFLGPGKLAKSTLVWSIKYVKPTLLKFGNLACFKINVFKIIIKRALIANQFQMQNSFIVSWIQ